MRCVLGSQCGVLSETPFLLILSEKSHKICDFSPFLLILCEISYKILRFPSFRLILYEESYRIYDFTQFQPVLYEKSYKTVIVAKCLGSARPSPCYQTASK